MSPGVLQRQPYRIFFPLGFALAWCGVGQWLLFSQGLIDAYLSIFHAMVQVQGFLTCFALGFLYTMVPRRTESAPPGAPVLMISALCPVGTTVAAGLELWPLAQVFWLILLGTLGAFLGSRIRQGKRRPPARFVWLPGALFCGFVGSVLTGVGAAVPGYWELHELGRGLVLQGMFCCLVVGVGGFAVPLMTRGEAPPDLGGYPAWRRDLALHVAGVLLLLGSFAVEHFSSVRIGHGARGAVMLVVLLLTAGIHKPPTKPGAIRWLLFVGIWCTPLGYLISSVWPELGKGGLHITFIAGFGLLALSVASQVILGHGGYEALKLARPWPLVLMAVSLGVAVVARVQVALHPEDINHWLTLGATAFLLATLCWAGFLLPRLLREPRPFER